MRLLSLEREKQLIEREYNYIYFCNHVLVRDKLRQKSSYLRENYKDNEADYHSNKEWPDTGKYCFDWDLWRDTFCYVDVYTHRRCYHAHAR